MQKAEDFTSLYVDFDSFFARAEQHLRPHLRDRPVGIIPLRSRHTVLIAASPEAKRLGIKTGTPVSEALQLCPTIALVEARHEVYVKLHHQILAVIDDVVPIQKTCSIDEVCCRLLSNERAVAIEIAKSIKRMLALRIGPTLTCSIGLAPNELLAKIAAEMEKPDGLVTLRQQDLPGRLLSLKLTDIPGIARGNSARLKNAEVTTIAELWGLSSAQLRAVWGGVQGERFWAFLHGFDIQPTETQRGMFGHSRVLGWDWRGPERTEACARLLLVKATRRMRRENFSASALSLGLKSQSDQRWMAEHRGPAFRDDHIALHYLKCLFQRASDEGALGQTKKVQVTLHGLVRNHNLQLNLLETPEDRRKRQRWECLSDLTDQLCARYMAPVLTLGFHGETPGKYTGAKIAFGRIPSLADF